MSGKAGLGRIYLEGLLGDPDYRRAYEYINEAADQQEPYGICLLGEIYANGIDCEKDIEKAKELYWKSAMLGCARGQLMLGKLYLASTVNEDKEYGIGWIKKAVKQENGEAEYILGNYYKEKCENFEPPTVKKLYEKSARHGFYEAQLKMAQKSLENQDDLEGLKRAHKLISIAANKGSRKGQYLLGKMYDEGLYLTEDKKIAYQYYEQAALKGYAKAQLKVGYMFWKGIGVEADKEKAKEWLKKAADQGLTEAEYQYSVFLIYYYDGYIAKLVLDYALRAANKNHVEAMNVAGWYCMRRHTLEERQEGFQWFKKAAELGSEAAIYNLGALYLNGSKGIVAKNLELAEKYLKEAAEKGFTKAYATLSRIYQTDEFYRKNLMTAIQYLKLAGKEGKEELNEFLKKCASMDDIDYLVFFKKITGDVPEAYRYLGDMYMKGIGTAKNYKEAYTYYRKAQESKVEGVDYQAIFEKIDQLITFELTYNEAMSILKTSDFQKAIDKLIELANKNYPDALVTVGKLYMEGYRVKKDLNIAKRYLYAARGQGNAEAEQCLKAIGED